MNNAFHLPMSDIYSSKRARSNVRRVINLPNTSLNWYLRGIDSGSEIVTNGLSQSFLLPPRNECVVNETYFVVVNTHITNSGNLDTIDDSTIEFYDTTWVSSDEGVLIKPHTQVEIRYIGYKQWKAYGLGFAAI